jgi:uncharacterized protein
LDRIILLALPYNRLYNIFLNKLRGFMKKLIASLMLIVSTSVFAEASFDQIERLIEQKQFAAAESGLVEIIKNHPQSAKAYYAMAQAQAGLGNLEKAQYALNKARGLSPSLDFASSSNVSNLERAITPQVQKIEYVSESHFWRNVFIFLVVAGAVYAFIEYRRRKDDDGNDSSSGVTPRPTPPSDSPSDRAYVREHKLLDTPAPTRESRQATSRVYRTSSVSQPTYQTQPTVVNNHYGSTNDGFLTGMLVGEALSGGHHDHTTIIERETVREAPSRSSSWDSDSSSSYSSSSSRSSSWDDDSSSSRSSSWDDDSSSSYSSSWDSGSSSSKDDSWDSGSSSSSDSW